MISHLNLKISKSTEAYKGHRNISLFKICTLFSVKFTLFSVKFTLFSVNFSFFSVKFTLFSVKFTYFFL